MMLVRLLPALRPPIVASRSVAPIASLFPDAVADDSWSVFAILAASAIVGRGFGTTAVGRALSAPVCAMVVTFVLTAAHVLPEATKAVTGAQGLAVQLATPLLLLNADLRAVSKRATQPTHNETTKRAADRRHAGASDRDVRSLMSAV